jgi:hypothetical protein
LQYFPDYGWFQGVVEEHRGRHYFVRYEDGDRAEYSEDEMEEIAIPHYAELSPVQKGSFKEMHDDDATSTKRKASSMPDPIVSVNCAEPSLLEKNSSKETHQDDATSTKRQASSLPDPIASCAEPSLVKKKSSTETRHEDDATSTKSQASSVPDPIASCAEPSLVKKKSSTETRHEDDATSTKSQASSVPDPIARCAEPSPVKTKPSNKETQHEDNATSTKPKASSIPEAIAASYENNSSTSRGRMTHDHSTITMVQPEPYTMASKLSKQGNIKRLPIPQAVISEQPPSKKVDIDVENSR